MAKDIRISVQSFDETAAGIHNLLQDSKGIINASDGKSYVRIGDQVFSAETTRESTALLSRLAAAEPAEISASDEERLLRDVLAGRADASRLRSYGCRDHAGHCIILFRLAQWLDGKTLRSLIPLEHHDRIIALENGDAVLMIDMDGRTQEDVLEFASAVVETLESEAGISCCAGVGKTYSSPEGIAASFRDAAAALETGLRHKIPGVVFVYGRHMLEMFADLMKPEEAEKLKKEIIPNDAEKLLTEETLETIRVFFQNDLNLSTAARQLFIHRNTLIYRMEKIRKATGLDLRKFEDAAVFRIVMSIPDKQV